MPKLSVWFIHSSLLYLAAGFTLGALLLVNKGLPFSATIWLLLPAHIEFVMFGWLVMLVMGTAFWILPRFSRPPKRGNEPLAWTAFFLLHAGIWATVVTPLWATSSMAYLIGWALEIAGIVAFVIHAWPRIKAAGVG
jgi:cbb3-type cytochrome oxidase subunit 1